MKITIVGGGNIGTQFAVHCAAKGHEVIIYSSCPELFEKHLNILDEHDNTSLEGDIKFATSNPDLAFKNVDYIIITMPSTMMNTIAEIIFKHSNTNTIIGIVPGNGGGECAFKKCIERGNIFFGIERVPAIARLVKKGKTVKSTGYRNELHVSAIPNNYSIDCANFIESIFDKKTVALPNFLNLTMTPSNPILHTSRLRILFENWHEGIFYDSIPLFYEEWDDSSSELLIKCDDEVQKICKNLSDFDLSYVKSLRVHYESATITEMTKKISSIEAFKGLTTPTVNTKNGLIPDLHSRYFTSDFSFGLNIINQIAIMANIDTPNINKTIEWYKNIAIERNEFRYTDYQINNFQDLKKFYLT